MAIEKFLAMENGEPGYTKIGAVTHVPFAAGGNGVQMAYVATSNPNAAWDNIPNKVEVPVSAMGNIYIEFTSNTPWCVAFTPAGVDGVEVRVMDTGLVDARWSWNDTFGETATDINMSVTHRWALKGGLDVAGGGRRFELWCDGVKVAEGSTTGRAAPATISRVMLTYNRRQATAVASNFDSVVISTDGFKGDCHVDYLVPDGNGDTSQWVGSDSDSVDNWELVDEIPPSNADYAEADEVDLRDLYTVTNLPASGTILGVQAVVHPWKLGSGAEIPTSTILKTGSGEHVDLIEGMSTAMQGLETPIRTTRPGGGAWTVADVNAMQIGVTTEEP